MLLGVSGSVAAYRAADLARELMRRGFDVHVCLTLGATGFVTPALFEALTGNPCLVGAFDEPERGRMAHIDRARASRAFVIAPATANVLAKLAGGVADDMLTTAALAYTGPLVLAPAMNPSMYDSEPVRAALAALAARGALVVEPSEGDVACGESGQGKLASIERIVESTQLAATRSTTLAGKRVLITSGPTQEPIDAVRFLSNRSSGKMGAALARAATMLGAEVTVVTGPASAPLPPVEIHRVRTAREMLSVAEPLAPGADWILGAAAVADYRPEETFAGKLRRSTEPTSLTLVPNPDVLARLASMAKPDCVKVGFAAEHGLDEAGIRAKRDAKGIDVLAVNDVSRDDVGFESEENELTLHFGDGARESSGRQSKLACAIWLYETVARARS